MAGPLVLAFEQAETENGSPRLTRWDVSDRRTAWRTGMTLTAFVHGHATQWMVIPQ